MFSIRVENFAAARFVVWSGHGQRFHKRGKRLFDVKIRIAFPARIHLQFPVHARQGRTDQPVIDLLRDRPTAGVDFLVAFVEIF